MLPAALMAGFGLLVALLLRHLVYEFALHSHLRFTPPRLKHRREIRCLSSSGFTDIASTVELR